MPPVPGPGTCRTRTLRPRPPTPERSGDDLGDRQGRVGGRGRARTAYGRGRPARRRARRPSRRCRCTARAAGPGPGCPAPSARSSASARSREFAATPPPISRSLDALVGGGVERLAGQHVADRLLERRRDVRDRHRLAGPLAGLDPARDGGLEPGEREVEAVPLQVARGGQPAREVDRTRGRRSRAARSMCGPPGNGSPSSRATLSNASPAASSMVAPSGSTPPVTSSTSSRLRVPAADQQRHARLGQRAVLELVDGDVRGEVVDAVDRLAQPDAPAPWPRPRRRAAPRPGPGRWSPRSRRRRAAGCRRSRRPARSSAPSPRGAPGWRPRARRRRTARAPRRCWRPRRRAASCPRTMPTPVSSQEVSIPRTSGSLAHAAHCADPGSSGLE